ncbi:MAG: ABC transporter ATP-binding protein [Clostridium sp.]
MEIEKRKYWVVDYIRIPFDIMPMTVICIVILRVFTAAIPSIQVLVTASFIDTAIDVFENGGMNRIYYPLLWIMVLIGFSWLSSMLLSFMKLKLDLQISEVIRPAVIKKRSRLDYKHVENNETWDLISRVGQDTSERIVKGFENLLSIIDYGVRIAGLIFLIATQVWWIAIAVVCIGMPLLLLAFKSGKADYEAFEEANKVRRKANYLKEVLSSRENVEERHLFGYTNAIDKRWFHWFEIARNIEMKADVKNSLKMKTASIIVAFLSMIIALILIRPVSSGDITVGMYMSLVTVSFNLVQQISWQLTVVMMEYTKNKLYLRDFTEFSNLEEVFGVDGLPDVLAQKIPFESIEFKDVYFAYPGTDRKILNGISMNLKNNRQYAFVGENGAGKTTITKLLTGLYDNYKGDILINGRNIREFTQAQLKAYFSVVYQDFAKYYVTLKDNVLLGKCGEVLNDDKQKELVEKALDSMKMIDEINKLPKGIGTSLGKIEGDGIDLSGGQWQRVAIARTIVSDAPIYILDEPTAALDPINESKVYELFGQVSKGKSTILITHRLGAARLADEVLVVDKGKIAERGSHEELICKKGIYAEMFEAQRSWYNEE